MTLEEIKKAPDLIVEQEYVKKDGRRRLGDVVYRSARLGAEVRVSVAKKEKQVEQEYSGSSVSSSGQSEEESSEKDALAKRGKGKER